MARGPVRLLAVLIAMILTIAAVSLIAAEAPANEHFQRTWARTDQQVLDGTVARTWIWGPEGNTGAIEEPYLDSPGEKRTVQYFDKSRMEINDPAADPASSFYVTNGLLVVELMTGEMQVGHEQFETHSPALVNVAGDQDDPNSPTYAVLAPLRSAPALPDGAIITQRLDSNGTVTDDPSLADQNVTAAYRVTVPNIDHQVASPFWEFLNSSGPVIVDGQEVNERLFDPWFYATGYPITEAYWADVKVAGTVRLVLLQCFERRCLTYTPGNPEGFLTEAGNVGQHYYTWRYEQVPGEATPTATAPGDPTATATATATATSTVTPTATATATPEPPTSYEYVTRWGGQYTPIDPMKMPWSMALDADDNIWVTDHNNHRVLQFDADGRFLRAVGSEGTGSGQFRNPAGIAVYNGLVYVTDSRNHRVQVFNLDGVYQFAWGTEGTGNSQLKTPFGITVHDNAVYVADSHNHRVQVFTLAGIYQAQFGSFGSGNGQLNTPLGLQFNAAGNLHVVDSGNHRVQVFASGGTYIRQFGSFSNEPSGLYFPYDVAFDAGGTVYVTNHANGRIQKFNATGTYLGQWESLQSDARFGYLTGMLIDEQDNLFALDLSSTGRIQKFTLDGDRMFVISDSRRGRFSALNGVTIDSAGDVFVVDPYVDRPTLARYSNTGTPLDDMLLAALGTLNTGDPLAVTSSNDGYLYVAIGGVNRIVKLSSDFGYYRNWGGTGSGQGQFNAPHGLATDADGNVYVADSGNNRIQKFDEDGNFLTMWGSAGTGNGQFDNVQGVAVYGDRVYATEFGNNRVQIFDRQGNYLGQFGNTGPDADRLQFPSGIAINPFGYVLVVDHGNSRVQLFTPDGERVSTFGSAGTGPGQFSGPLAIAVDDDGYVYITDLGNYSVHKFAPRP